MADRSGYIGRAPGDSSVIIARKSYEPTGVQTDFTFNSGYTPGYCDVYLNGVKLIDEKDYTASNGSTVGLTSAAQSGDIVELVVYKAYNLGVPLADVTGNLDITGYVSASSSITAGGAFYGDGSNLSNIAGVAVTQYIAANSLTVIGSPGVSTITRLGVTDAVVTGIITANGLSGNVTGAAITITGNATFNSNVTIGGTLTYEDVTNVDALGIVTARAGVNVSGGELKVGSAVTFSGVGVATFIGAAGVAVTITPSTGKVQATTFEGPLTGNVTGDITGDITGAVTGTTGSFSSNLTVGSGITFGSAGVATFSGTADIHLHDSVQLKIGDSSDLALYHNASGNSWMYNGTNGGDLYIGANAGEIYLQTGSSANDTAIKIVSDGMVELRHDNNWKLQTTNDGIYVNGIGTATRSYINSPTISVNENIPLLVKSILREEPAIGIQGPNANGYTWISDAYVDGESQASLGLSYSSSSFLIGNRVGVSTTADNTYVSLTDAFAFRPSAIVLGHDGDIHFRNDNTNGVRPVGTAVTLTDRMDIKGDGDIIYYSGASEKVRWRNSANALRLATNTQLNFGDSDAADIYVDSGQMIINNATGPLSLRSASVRLAGLTNEKFVVGNTGVGVTVYHNNSAKFETTNDGTVTTGIATATAGLRINADGSASANHLALGASLDDLLLWHQNGNSYFVNNDGNLTIRSDGHVYIQDASGNTLADFNEDGPVELYHNANKKFETTNDGVSITGIATATSVEDSKGNLRSIPQLTKNSQHALVASDAGQCCFSSSGGFVINDSVMSSGDAVTLINNSGSTMTITQGSGVTLYDTSDGSTGNKTLKARGIATVWFSTASIGYITGNFD